MTKREFRRSYRSQPLHQLYRQFKHRETFEAVVVGASMLCLIGLAR